MEDFSYKMTIFTATYNRKHTLNVLYKSLLKQSFKKFEWLIVDDGSTDNTKEFVKKIQLENKLKIQYHYKINEGKHRAINYGVKKAKGELFFIVDSDDRLPKKAIEIILDKYSKIKNRSDVAGVVGLKCFFDKKVVGNLPSEDNLICSSINYRIKYKVKGDRAEVFKREILKEFPFPEIGGEKFIAESIVWNRIAETYLLMYFKENVYECQYLDDGLSKNTVKLRINNPIGASLLYKELAENNSSFSVKIKAYINYWRFVFYKKETFKVDFFGNPYYSYPLIFISFLIIIKDNFSK